MGVGGVMVVGGCDGGRLGCDSVVMVVGGGVADDVVVAWLMVWWWRG